jgi:hypothetical protein
MINEDVEEIISAVGHSELVFFHTHQHRIQDHDPAPISYSHQLRKQLAKNQARYFPQYADYDDFLKVMTADSCASFRMCEILTLCLELKTSDMVLIWIGFGEMVILLGR